MNYVLGFLFRTTVDGLEVALIRKLHPAKQAGKLNGIGGKVEFDESFLEAMIREFSEETAAFVTSWVRRGCMRPLPGVTVHLFVATLLPGSDVVLRSVTDETVDWYQVAQLPQRADLMASLHEIIPLLAAGKTADVAADYETSD